MTDTMIGDWKLMTSENFEELMKEMGVGLVTRKLAMTTKPSIKFEKAGDEWIFTTSSAIKTTQIKYKLKTPVPETAPIKGRFRRPARLPIPRKVN